MAFEIQLNRPQARFEIFYRGDVCLAEREAVVLRVAAVAASTGFRQMLVDLRDAHCVPADFVSSNRFAALLARHARGHDWRIGYLLRVPAVTGGNRGPDQALDPALEALLDARGVVLGRFVAQAAALTWLQAGPSAAIGPRARATAAGLAPQTLRPAVLAGGCT